jgi:hypothetical protein
MVGARALALRVRSVGETRDGAHVDRCRRCRRRAAACALCPSRAAQCWLSRPRRLVARASGSPPGNGPAGATNGRGRLKRTSEREAVLTRAGAPGCWPGATAPAAAACPTSLALRAAARLLFTQRGADRKRAPLLVRGHRLQVARISRGSVSLPGAPARKLLRRCRSPVAAKLRCDRRSSVRGPPRLWLTFHWVRGRPVSVASVAGRLTPCAGIPSDGVVVRLSFLYGRRWTGRCASPRCWRRRECPRIGWRVSWGLCSVDSLGARWSWGVPRLRRRRAGANVSRLPDALAAGVSVVRVCRTLLVRGAGEQRQPTTASLVGWCALVARAASPRPRVA